MKPLILVGPINEDFARDFYDWIEESHYAMHGYSQFSIGSPGGDIGLMIGMYDQIIDRDIPTIAIGVVESAAAVLFLAGKTRYMYPNSMLLFREPERPQGSADMTDPQWYLHTKMVAMIVQRTGMDLIEAHDLFDGKFISAERALELGLCDKILNLGGQDGGTSGIPESQGSDTGGVITASDREQYHAE
jgi:ATP-dependent protease ClpP protease subunit